MNVAVGIGLYLLIFVIGIFLFICGLMTAIIVPNFMGLAGWDWIAVFLSTLSVVWGSGSGSLITIYRNN